MSIVNALAQVMFRQGERTTLHSHTLVHICAHLILMKEWAENAKAEQSLPGALVCTLTKGNIRKKVFIQLTCPRSQSIPERS